ncbi:GntR family transcriptional regulator [Companilactobacillus baiquanensis]|uniref:GntR family transcriptional regulator n=1 Tax=Companilactobacillus baiquanensis TaxID=2486005 RepID=A0ABW1UWN0_9LACO|nr:GntR family transcriptional regulator [Companilactobacillus baiquanensis]
MLTPKYQEIIEILTDELNHGSFNQGDKFYSESDICKRFDVSSTTAVKVLNDLQQKNKVTRIKGKGTFVAKENHRSVVLLTDLNMANGNTEGVKVLSAQENSDPKIQEILKLDPDSNYFEIKRLRYIGDEVVQYTVNFINPNYISKDALIDLHNFDSVYQRIREDSGIDPYKLSYTQKNTVELLDNQNILNYFNNKKYPLFMYQRRRTYLPNVKGSMLEFAYTYKDPAYWGYQTDSVFGSNI